jgi:ribosomal-protein-alanine N-acetyltransferase
MNAAGQPPPIRLEPVAASQAAAFLALYRDNRAHLDPWSPAAEPDFYTLGGQRSRLADLEDRAAAGTAFAFGIWVAGRLAGRTSLSAIERHAFQNGRLGYFLAADAQGRGYMTEAVRRTVRFAFEDQGLHRLEAGVMPENARSVAVLERVGFRRIGLAERYLLIGGRWRDHVLWEMTQDDRA